MKEGGEDGRRGGREDEPKRDTKVSEVFISSTAQGCDLSPCTKSAKSLANVREVLGTTTVSGTEAAYKVF